MATRVQVFDTVADLIAQSDAAHGAGHIHNGSDEASVCRPHFVGRAFASWQDVVQKANACWPEGVALVESLLHELGTVELPKPVDRKRRAFWSADSGDEVDNDRLRAGQEYWRGSRRQPATGTQTKAVVCNLFTSASRKSEEVLWRGVAAIVLANLLENAGYRAEVWVVDTSKNSFKNGDDLFHATCLKRANQPVDVATIVNAISGWFYRTVGFQAHYAAWPQEIRQDMGDSKGLTADSPEVQELVEGMDTVVIDKVWSRSGAIALVREVLEALGQ